MGISAGLRELRILRELSMPSETSELGRLTEKHADNSAAYHTKNHNERYRAISLPRSWARRPVRPVMGLMLFGLLFCLCAAEARDKNEADTSNCGPTVATLAKTSPLKKYFHF